MKSGLIDQQLETSVTRRRVVGTGVKLAYAAPIVAASFKLSDAAAQTIVSPTCTAGTCGAPQICGGEGTCACRTVAGASRCLQNEFCVQVSQCDEDADCPGGWCFPATDNCCGEVGLGRCVFPCGVRPPTADSFIGDDYSGPSVLGI